MRYSTTPKRNPRTVLAWSGCSMRYSTTPKRSAELEEQVLGDVADEVDDHVAAGEAPVDGAAELVAVATGDDRLQRHRVALLEHREVRATRRHLARVVDVDDEVGRHVLRARCAVVVATRAVDVHLGD